MLNHSIIYLTSDETIKVDNLNFKTWKYENKKKHEGSVYDKGKRNYHDLRGGHEKSISSKALKDLDSKLKSKTIVHSKWLSESLVALVLSTGIIVYLTINLNTQDVTQILYDRYFGNKLAGLTVAAVAFTKSHLLLTHPEGTATLFTFSVKHNDTNIPKISDRNPTAQTIELADFPRRAERYVSWSEGLTGVSRVVIWTAAGNDPAPWTPAAEFRTNLHVYQINSQSMNLLAFHQLTNETLLADISKVNFSTVHVVEQSHCQKSGVTLNWIRFNIPDSSEGVFRLSAHRASESRVPLPAVARDITRSPCDNKLLVACIDGSLHILHHVTGLTHSIKTAFGGSRSESLWVGSLIISAAGARISVYDTALQPLNPPITVNSASSKNTDSQRENTNINIVSTKILKTGCMLLILLEEGPLAVIRITHPKLQMGWLRSGQISRAVNLLRVMDWETDGEECMYTLQAIVKTVLRKGLSRDTECYIKEALGTYLGAAGSTAPQYHNAVTDIARIFFHHLLRRGRTELCLSLGVDLASWDLFRDVACSAHRVGDQAAKEEADLLALQYRDQHDTNSECSTCSYTSGSSTCSDDESSCYNETRPPPLPRLPLQSTNQKAPIQHKTTNHNAHITANHKTPLRHIHQPINSVYQRPQTNNQLYTNHNTASSHTPYTQSNYLPIQQSINHSTNQSTLMFVPVNQPEHSTAHSIRPNLHQYLEKESSIWNTEVKETISSQKKEGILQSSLKPTIDINRGTRVVGLYQKDGNTLYRYQDSGPHKSKDRIENGRNRNGEKNKVKFSNTVTINVVSEPSPPLPQPERELAESLPICSPHAYLAAFEPAVSHDNKRGVQKPPKIKVVHFGMV